MQDGDQVDEKNLSIGLQTNNIDQSFSFLAYVKIYTRIYVFFSSLVRWAQN